MLIRFLLEQSSLTDFFMGDKGFSVDFYQTGALNNWYTEYEHTR